MTERKAGFGAVVWRDGVKIDNIRQLFLADELKFEGATKKTIPPSRNVEMEFTFTWDNRPWHDFARLLAMFARRERKRRRRYQRQKRKQ